MKIYFFGADYPPTGGGIATFVYELIQTVSSHPDIENIKVTIFGNKKPRIESVNDKVQLFVLRDIDFFYVGWKVFLAFSMNRDYDIFHSLNLFPTAFWVALWGKIFRKKTLVTFYGTDACDTTASRKTYIFKKWTLKNISTPLTISEFTKRETEKKYGLNTSLIKVIYPIVPKALLSTNTIAEDNNSIISKIKDTYNVNENTFVIVSVARLVKRKGTEYLVRAVSQIKDKDIKLFIIGNGPEKDNLIKLTKDLNLTNTVFILGKVDDIIPFYNIADVAILSSYIIAGDGDFEGLGLVLLEAQSYGVPVIGTRSGGIPEAFEENVTGLLADERDEESLKIAILKLINDKELHRQFSNNTRLFLETRFGFDNTTNRYIELCRSL